MPKKLYVLDLDNTFFDGELSKESCDDKRIRFWDVFSKLFIDAHKQDDAIGIVTNRRMDDVQEALKLLLDQLFKCEKFKKAKLLKSEVLPDDHILFGDGYSDTDKSERLQLLHNKLVGIDVPLCHTLFFDDQMTVCIKAYKHGFSVLHLPPRIKESEVEKKLTEFNHDALDYFKNNPYNKASVLTLTKLSTSSLWKKRSTSSDGAAAAASCAQPSDDSRELQRQDSKSPPILVH